MAKDTLEKLKNDFTNWSDFMMEETEPEEILREIETMRYKLECEISDYASSLYKRVQELYNLNK